MVQKNHQRSQNYSFAESCVSARNVFARIPATFRSVDQLPTAPAANSQTPTCIQRELFQVQLVDAIHARRNQERKERTHDVFHRIYRTHKAIYDQS